MTIAAPRACPALSLDRCADRLERLRVALADHGAHVAVIHETDVIRWLIGATSMHGWPGALIVGPADAVAVLFATGEQPSIATEQVVLRGISRERAIHHHRELAESASPRLEALLRGGAARVGFDVQAAPAWIVRGTAAVGGGEPLDIAPLLLRLRRRKDPDELAIIEHDVWLAETAYRAATEVIAPGVSELEVFQSMSRAVETASGTSVAFGGDFMAGPGGGQRGGPPSTRLLQAGDSYVIDFFPNQGGYWADMCRTYPVGEPSQALDAALSATREAIELAETLIRPGTPVAHVDARMREQLAQRDGFDGDYFHLSGHGIGFRPHEAPWIVRDSAEVFEIGDVIAVEPGIYAEKLGGGVRIEDDYVVVDDGVRRLSDLPR